MFDAASDLWTKGVEAWLSVMGAGNTGAAGDNPLGIMMGAISSLLPRGTDPASDRFDESGGWQAAAGQFADMSPAMAQAWMVSVGSAFRYCRTLAEVHARYQGALVQAAVDRSSGQMAVPASECRVLADELRTWLREIGDAAMLEARRLQAELDVVGEQIARVADATTPTDSGVDPRARRHRVKE